MHEPVSLFPLDGRCRLLSNLLWTHDEDGRASLYRQHLWVRFPRPVQVVGARFIPAVALHRLRFETSRDEGRTWEEIAQVATATPPEGVCLLAPDPDSAPQGATFTASWPVRAMDNLRVVVAEAANPVFPLRDYFHRLELLCSDGLGEEDGVLEPEYRPLQEGGVSPWQPVAGHPARNIYDRLGHCHQPMETDRVRVSADADGITMTSQMLTLRFSRHFALLRALGWDMTGQGRQQDNLLACDDVQGAFPVVLRGGERRASDVGGGTLEAQGRRVTYRDVSVVPELRQTLTFAAREDGFRLELAWQCAESFRTAEVAALRLPLDLYQSVMDVLALPNTTGPSGLVNLPLVIHAPNHGSLQVTVVENSGPLPVLARVSPFRVRAELWLDLIVGAAPLDNGLFEVPAGEGRVALDFQLTKIFPLANTDIYSRWQRPPSYSFVDEEPILGALPNEWLSGLSFRPDLAMFANNSVAEAAPLCAPYYADIAAYTPDLAPGLPATDILRCATDSLLYLPGQGGYSDYREFPMAASAPLDCAWLTVAATGDWEWAAQRRDVLAHWAGALLSMEYGQTGLAASRHTGRPDVSGYFSSSWWDSFRSGHLESFNNAMIYRAAGRAEELLARLGGEEALVAALHAMRARAREHFISVFYDPQTRRMAQWVDVDGVRYGFDSHPHLSAPILCGLIPEALGRQLLQEYLQRLEQRGFRAYQYGLPLVLEPVPPHLHNGWVGKGVERDGSDAYGAYLNGSLNHKFCYYTLQALYRLGLRREANDLFRKLTPLVRLGGTSGGLHSGLDCRTPEGAMAGYEGLLAEQFQFLLAAITGYLGWELTIDGLKLDPAVRAACSDRVQTVRPNFARVARE